MIDYSRFPDVRHTGDTVLRQAQLVMLRMLCIIDDICRRHELKYWLCSGTLLGAIRHKGFIPWDDDLDICMLREDYEKFLIVAQQELPDDMFVQTRELDPLYDYLPLPCKIRDKKSLITAEGQENKKFNMGLFVDIFPMDRYHKKRSTFKKEYLFKTSFYYLCKAVDCELNSKTSRLKQFVNYFNPVFRSLLKVYLRQIQPTINRNKNIGTDCFVGHGFDTPWRRFFDYADICPMKEAIFEGYSFMIPNNADAYLTELYGKDYMTPPPKDKQKLRHATLIIPDINLKEE